MVTSESVEKACSEVSDYSDEQMAAEFERFFKAQPAVCDFVVDLTSESTPAIQELSLFLSYMIFRTLEVSQTGKMPAITPEAIETAFHESESWVETISGAAPDGLESHIVSSLASDGEPFLLQYIISEINQPMEDGAELPEDDKGEVFFLLKTVIVSLSKSTPRIHEV